MRQYEDMFLEIYPLSQYGVTNVMDCGPDSSRGYGREEDQIGGPKTPEQKIMWDAESPDELKDEILFKKSPREQALVVRRKIWDQFLTKCEREYQNCFIIQAQPEYDRTKVVPTAVRTVRKDHVIVELAPVIGNTDYEKIYRYHLKLEDCQWRIDYRERMVNPKKGIREAFM